MQSVLWLLKCPSTVSINNFCALANSIKTCLSNYPQKTGSVIPNKTMSQQSVKPNDLEIIWNRNPVDSYHFHEIEPYSRQATATDRTRTWYQKRGTPSDQDQWRKKWISFRFPSSTMKPPPQHHVTIALHHLYLLPFLKLLALGIPIAPATSTPRTQTTMEVNRELTFNVADVFSNFQSGVFLPSEHFSAFYDVEKSRWWMMKDIPWGRLEKGR